MSRKAAVWARKSERAGKKLGRASAKLLKCQARLASELEALREMRRLARGIALKVPIFCEIQSGRDPEVMALLQRALAVDPRSEAGRKKRWRWLREAWARTDAIMAKWPSPGQPLAWQGCDLRQARVLFRQGPARRRSVRTRRRLTAAAKEQVRSARRQVQRLLARWRKVMAAG